MRIRLIYSLALSFFLIVTSIQSFAAATCPNDPKEQALRSAELQSIVQADQKDRVPPIDWSVIGPRDQQRATRVAEIFAEGCLASADDYAAAAMVFQHGTVPDHYYQAYIWAKRAFDLGKKEEANLMADAVDRYLISVGQKQLFAAQTFRNGPGGCHCLGEVEQSFPDQLRIEYTGESLAKRIDNLKNENKSNPMCADVLYCPTHLKTPVKGQFPGIW